LVVAAAGNDGSSGLWTYGHPAAETDAIAVGSTDNKHSLGAELKLNVNIRVDKQGSTSTVGESSQS
jgi:subtilisin family serine protease